jgi:hypothetical protein
LEGKLEDNLKAEMDKNMELIKKDQLNLESRSRKKDQVQDEVHDEVELNHLVFDPLLRSMAHIDYVFFPIISKFHYTLLVLNKNEKKWTHYNPLRKRSELHIDPCFEIAKQMVRKYRILLLFLFFIFIFFNQ